MPGVTTPHKAYKGLLPSWERCRDVVAGSAAVKAKGSMYLPLLDSHKRDITKYRAYVDRALFYNATGRTVAGLAGGIFQKAPSVEADETVLEDCKDITLTGQTLEMFALEMTQEYLTVSRYGVLIDMQSEATSEPRPYWVGYKAEQIVNWRFRNIDGDQKLCLVVLKEEVPEENPKDEFDPEIKTQYRVLRLSPENVYSQQLYIEVKNNNNVPGVETVEKKFEAQTPTIPERMGQSLDFIPFALPWFITTPAIMDLVEVNISHYKGYADLKHGLHYTALPTPWVAGQKGDLSKPLEIGSGKAWTLEKDGQAGMLEFTGKGLGSIRQDLQDMQRIMATLGARLLEEAPKYTETATAVSMRHAGDYATLRTLGQVVEQQLTFILQVHQWWKVGGDKPTEVAAKVELNKIFYDQTITADELRALIIALQSNAISYETFYMRLSNAGWMREGVTSEEEVAAIKSQPPMLGLTPLAGAQKVGEGEKLAQT